MLKSISCDKFLSHGSVRKPIIFHTGLNTVLGSSDAKNSIGKSTFLMIIDFVFGGEDYVNKETKDAIEKVGHHTFNFSFEFGNELLYFSRSTDNPSFVNMCDSNYRVIKPITVDAFNKALANRYGLLENGISLRDSVGRFFRIYHKDTTDEHFPLRAATRESVNTGITALLKLFNVYNSILEQDIIKKEAQDKSTTLIKARKYSQIKAASTKAEFEKNNKLLEEMQQQLDDLTRETQSGLSDLDAVQAQELADIKSELSILRRQRTQLKSQMDAMKDDQDYSKKNFKHAYDSLKEFFPEANYQELEKVEGFHSKLSMILKKEFKEKTDEIKLLLSLVNEKIEVCEARAKQIKTAPNVSKAILLRFAELTKSIELLKEANKNYIESQKLQKASKEEKEKYEHLVKDVISSVQDSLNTTMKEYTDFVYSGTKTSPKIDIIDSSHYNFYTPNDTGTGSLCRGLVIFDLVVLNNTKLPAVIHDTVILKHIDDETLEKLIELYKNSPKQVFIAFDRDTTYSYNMQTILNDSKVLKLSSGGNELFGRAWNEVEVKKEV